MAPKKPAPTQDADPLLGQPAPEAALWDHEGKARRLSEFRGRRVVLYFYPKDMTTGCTAQACAYNALLPTFEDLDAVVLGVSPDDAASHQKFRAKHGLGFALLFDPTKKALEAFGVWKEKSMYGRTFMGVERSTFVLDREGVVVAAWRRVKPEEDPVRVRAFLEQAP